LSIDGGSNPAATQCSVSSYDQSRQVHSQPISQVLLDTERVNLPSLLSTLTPKQDNLAPDAATPTLQVSVLATEFESVNELIKNPKHFQQSKGELQVFCSVQFNFFLFGILPLPLHRLELLQVKANRTEDSYTTISFPLALPALPQQRVPSLLSFTMRDKPKSTRGNGDGSQVATKAVSNTSVGVCESGSRLDSGGRNSSFVRVCVGAVFNSALLNLGFPLEIHAPALDLAIGQSSADDGAGEVETSGWRVDTTAFVLRLDPVRAAVFDSNFTIACFALGAK